MVGQVRRETRLVEDVQMHPAVPVVPVVPPVPAVPAVLAVLAVRAAPAKDTVGVKHFRHLNITTRTPV